MRYTIEHASMRFGRDVPNDASIAVQAGCRTYRIRERPQTPAKDEQMA
jgi:hypothetical protein